MTIAGTGFTGATGVSFNGSDAAYTVDSATQITAIVPTGASTGPIAVTTDAGTATSATSFTVVGTANLYVAFFGSNTVAEITPSGQILRSFVPPGSGGLSATGALRFGPDGHLYVGSVGAVKKYDGLTGTFLGDFVTGPSASDLLFAGAGNLYVAE